MRDGQAKCTTAGLKEGRNLNLSERKDGTKASGPMTTEFGDLECVGVCWSESHGEVNEMSFILELGPVPSAPSLSTLNRPCDAKRPPCNTCAAPRNVCRIKCTAESPSKAAKISVRDPASMAETTQDATSAASEACDASPRRSVHLGVVDGNLWGRSCDRQLSLLGLRMTIVDLEKISCCRSSAFPGKLPQFEPRVVLFSTPPRPEVELLPRSILFWFEEMFRLALKMFS